MTYITPGIPPLVISLLTVAWLGMCAIFDTRTRQVPNWLTLPAIPLTLLALSRQYWEIETGLHYRRDITLKEDATRLTLGTTGHTMAIFNNAVIGLCLQNGYQNLAQARRLFNAKPELAFDLLCFDKSHSC
jgi:hypothetical protein